MLRDIVLLSILVSASCTSGKNTELLNTDSCHAEYDKKLGVKVYLELEKEPEFPGGTSRLMDYLSSNIIYKTKEDAFGKAMRFEIVIDTSGRIIRRRITAASYAYIDRQIINAIDKMPKWKAGECNNRKVISLHHVIYQR